MGGAVKNRRQFEREVLPYLDTLYAAAFHLTGDQRRAGDLCEEALLRAYSLFAGCGAASNRRVWLLTILFKISSVQSSSGEQATAASRHLLPGRVERPGGYRNSACASSPVNAKSGDFEIQDLFQNLPPECRLTLYLVDAEQLSYPDAARVLEVPIETVRSRVSHGRALMRCALKR
jgi:RNA polymerase sigma-70 factor, ECF subfamily